MNTSYLKKKTDQYEIYHTTSKSLDAELRNEKTDFAVEGESEGIAITVVKGGRIGFSSTNNLSNFKKTVDRALSVARANSKDKDFKGFVKPQKIPKIKNYDNALLTYSLKDFEKLKKEFLSKVKSVNKKILLGYGAYNKNIDTVRILNSEGVDLKETSAFNLFSYDLTLKKKGDILSVYGGLVDIKTLEAQKAETEAKRILKLANKKSMKTMNCQAVFHPEAIAAILGKTLIPNVNSENTQQGKSVFLEKLNKKIMSDKLTITDDATTKGLLGTSSFDCEGTPAQKNVLVKKGVLKTFLYNNYTAKKDKKKSTGNASRTLNSRPSVGPNNIILNPGKTDNLTSGIKKGIYVREIMGAHTINALTGDFSLGLLEGHYIENGKIKHPIKNAMISGNIFKLLNQVTAVGSKTEHAFSGHGASYLPEISFKEIKLIGQN